MARLKKNTIDYFPHPVNDGKRMFIMEQQYGDKGYCCYYKLLQILGKTEDHYLDFSIPKNRLYFAALIKSTPQELSQMLQTLSDLGAIDSELWREREIIWCQELVDSVSDLYLNKRHRKPPERPNKVELNTPVSEIIVAENPQSKVKESRVEESKVNYLRVRDKIYEMKVSEYMIKNESIFMEQWQMQNKNIPVEKVLEEMDKEYICYDFNNENHIKNSFKTCAKKITNGTARTKKSINDRV